jgi:hypothetical protein
LATTSNLSSRLSRRAVELKRSVGERLSVLSSE